MYKLSLAGIAVACLLVAGNLCTPATAIAEETQQEETDLEFSNRMTQRIKVLQSRIKQLQTGVDSNRGRTASNQTQSTGRTSRDDILGGPQRDTSGWSGTDRYSRAKIKLKHLQRKVDEERIRLQAPQGSQSKSRQLDRKSSEKNIRRLERDVDQLQRELYGR